MTELPVVDTALEGFRLTRERPLAVLLWAGVLLAGQLAAAAVLSASGHAGALATLGRGPASPDEMAARFTALAPALPAIGLASLVALCADAVVIAAVLRSVFSGAREPAGGLRLGLAELRQLGVALALIAIAWAALTVAMLGAALAAAPLTVMAGGAQPLLTALVLAAATAAVLFLMVRLSLAPAATLMQERIVLRRAWPLTKGLFWPLFGAYLLAAALAVVVSALSSLVVAVAWMAATRSSLAAAAAALSPDLSSVAALTAPGSVVGLLFNALLNAVLLAIVVGPVAAAHQALAPRRGLTA